VTEVVTARSGSIEVKSTLAAPRSAPHKSFANYTFALYSCYISVPTNTGLLKGFGKFEDRS